MATNPLSSFLPLGDSSSLYTLTNHEKGQLIILCTWFRATNKHIAKYITFHQTHFTGAKILLIRSSMKGMTLPYSLQQALVKPATEVIRTVISECSPGTSPRILLHVFSTGGASTATQLLLQLHKELKRPAPLLGLVCDSAPSRSSYRNGLNGLLSGIPEGLLYKTAGIILVHTLFALMYSQIAIGRYDIPENLYWATLSDERFHADPNGGQHRIAYIASKKDNVTAWEDVVAHAREMKGKGWVVEELFYEDTAHCNHLTKDEGAYLELVKGVWDRSPDEDGNGFYWAKAKL